jgi:two-component system NarL family response regulator
VLRQALRMMLEREADIEVVSEATTGHGALSLAKEIEPDVVVMDIKMPGLDGIHATHRLANEMPDVKVLGLSTHSEMHYIRQMLASGAQGYLTKACSITDLLAAVRAVAQGRTYLCPQAASVIAQSARQGLGALSAVSTRILSRRETEVLRLLAEGRTSNQIGEKLYIAAGTVDVHRRNVMRKLGLHKVAELTQYAVREGLITV